MAFHRRHPSLRSELRAGTKSVIGSPLNVDLSSPGRHVHPQLKAENCIPAKGVSRGSSVGGGQGARGDRRRSRVANATRTGTKASSLTVLGPIRGAGRVRFPSNRDGAAERRQQPSLTWTTAEFVVVDEP